MKKKIPDLVEMLRSISKGGESVINTTGETEKIGAVEKWRRNFGLAPKAETPSPTTGKPKATPAETEKTATKNDDPTAPEAAKDTQKEKVTTAKDGQQELLHKTSDTEVKIEPLKLKNILNNNWRKENAINYAHESIKVFVIAGIVSVIGAEWSQGKYRELAHYSGDPSAPFAEKKEPANEKNETIEKKESSLLEDAQKIGSVVWGRVKNNIENTDAYKIMMNYIKDLRNTSINILEAGDNIAFWGPFLVLFSTTLSAVDRFIKMKRKLNGSMEPEEELKYEITEKKLNEIISRLNAISEEIKTTTIKPQEIEEVKKMKQELEELIKRHGLTENKQ